MKGQRTSSGKPSKGETLTGPAKTSVKEDTVYKGGKGTVKKPPGGGSPYHSLKAQNPGGGMSLSLEAQGRALKER